MNQIDSFNERLLQIAREAKESIRHLLKQNNITSVNFTPYMKEGDIIGYHLFFDVDKKGNGVALEVDTLTFENGKVLLDMSENEGGYYGQYNLDNLQAHETIYILDMLTGVIKYSKEQHLPILKDGQDFEDAIPEVPAELQGKKGFVYNGMHFIPAGTFKDHGFKEIDKIWSHLKNDLNHPLVRFKDWNYDQFYLAAGHPADDIFWLEEKGFYVCPGGNCLFEIDVDKKQ